MGFLTALLALAPAVRAVRCTVSENHDENPGSETIFGDLDFRKYASLRRFRKIERELEQARRERDEAILAGQTLEASLKEARAEVQRLSRALRRETALRRGLEEANIERAQAARYMRNEIAAQQANNLAQQQALASYAYQAHAQRNALQQALANPFADLEHRLRAEGLCHCVPGRHELLSRP